MVPVEDGRVQVNGEILTSPAKTVTEADEIVVDGKALPQNEKARLFLYHKPAGLVTTNKDERGRETIFDQMPKGLPRVVTVGRLDINTEGLLLLTNDGGLARHLELPATGWKRKYRVRVHGRVNEEKLASLADGITIEGVRYKSIEAAMEKSQGTNSWLNITLVEGKNREIRKVMEALGLKVNRLIRVSYGPFVLGDLPRGVATEVKPHVLRHQVRDYFKDEVKEKRPRR